MLPYLPHDNRDLRLKACITRSLAGTMTSASSGEGAPGGDYKTVVHHKSNESVGFIAEVLQALIGVVTVDKGALAAVS